MERRGLRHGLGRRAARHRTLGVDDERRVPVCEFSGIDDESFALENLRISVDSASVPEPSALALFGLALSGFAFARRKA